MWLRLGGAARVLVTSFAVLQVGEVDFFDYKRGLSGNFPKLYRLLAIMDTILDIFTTGDAAWESSSRIGNLWCELHVTVVETFGLSACRPKIHYGHHLAAQMRLHRLATSTFSNERRNRILKRVHQNLRHFRDPVQAGLYRWTDRLLAWHKTSDLTGLAPLGISWQAPRGLAEMVAAEGDFSKVVVSKKMAYQKGTLKKGDVIKTSTPNGSLMRVELCIVAYRRVADAGFLICTGYPDGSKRDETLVRISDVADKCFSFFDQGRLIVIPRKM